IQSSEAEWILGRHVQFFTAWAQEAESRLRGRDQKTWLDRFAAEYDNIRAVLNWTLQTDANAALQLVGTLGEFWHVRGYLKEARKWLTDALQQPESLVHPSHKARVLNVAARIALDQGEYTSTNTFSQQALALSRDLGDKSLIATARHKL